MNGGVGLLSLKIGSLDDGHSSHEETQLLRAAMPKAMPNTSREVYTSSVSEQILADQLEEEPEVVWYKNKQVTTSQKCKLNPAFEAYCASLLRLRQEIAA